MKEVIYMWKDVPGWERFYEASDTGEVRNKETGRLIVGDKNYNGSRDSDHPL